jgi:DNA replication licensing factor MCM3
VTDDVEENRDRMIADHVLRMHRYIPPGVEEGTPVHDNLEQPLSVDGPAHGTDADSQTTVWEKFDPLLHIGIAHQISRTRSGKSKKKEILSIAFVKKYIQYAKSRPPPVLTKGAADHIIHAYSNLRNDDQEGKKRTSPLTARTLETMIRLATAHAKARFSTKVEMSDAAEAEAIMRFALFKEVPKRQRRKRRKLNAGSRKLKEDGMGEDEDGSDSEEDSDEEEGQGRMSIPPQLAPTRGAPTQAEDPVWGDSSVQMDTQEAILPPTPLQVGLDENGNIRPER